jgi:hypothetical protein
MKDQYLQKVILQAKIQGREEVLNNPEQWDLQTKKAPTRIFFVDEVRALLHQLDKEKISLSKFVEILNEKATGLTSIELYKISNPK